MKSIDAFVQGLCAIPLADFTLEAVKEYLLDHDVDPATLAPYLHYESTHYTRNLIYRCEAFELMAICWDVGQGSRIHNHQGQRCWMTAPIGKLVVQNYAVVEEDPSRGYCKLEEADRVLMQPGQPAFVHPDQPIHAVLNPAEHGERAASLHVYSLPYDACVVYSLEQDSAMEVPLQFDTEYGKPVPSPA